MAENVIVINFDVESEAYQAFSDLKRIAVNPEFVISEACILKNVGGRMITRDFFDSGKETRDDANKGGLIGSLAGVLGGPLGIILCSGLGYIIGRTKDMADKEKNATLIERVCALIPEGATALVALASEMEYNSIDMRIEKFSGHITRLDAAEIAEEVEKAREIQRQMAKEARQKLREEKKKEAKQKVEERRAKMKADFDRIKAKIARK
ncbi:MAG: DUF1269 domain-containing protein [Firmicutes bacterium]|nr:DUF1269 domain-containing protein [Bacillota bacterium]